MTEREYVRPPTRARATQRGRSEPDEVRAGGGGGPNMAPELPAELPPGVSGIPVRGVGADAALA